jgi:hypothetical protein
MHISFSRLELILWNGKNRDCFRQKPHPHLSPLDVCCSTLLERPI